jgi:multicomponent Na+:H+ antiporter subunit G
MGDVRELLTGVAAIAGALLMLLSGVGVLRLRDLYARMHAATKASTLGALLVGFAGIIGLDGGRSKLVLAVVFLFITGPSSAHLVARAAYRAEGVDIDVERHDDLADAFDARDPVPPLADRDLSPGSRAATPGGRDPSPGGRDSSPGGGDGTPGGGDPSPGGADDERA